MASDDRMRLEKLIVERRKVVDDRFF